MRSLLLLFLFLLFLILPTAALSAADYAVRWSTIAGGGGTSTGGVFTARATLGQPLAGPMLSAPPYAFTGGFWTFLESPPPPDGPPLVARVQGGRIVISWPVSAAGYVLQESLDLTGPNGAPWFNSNLPVAVVDGQNVVTAGMVGEKIVGEKGLTARFFRLAKP